MWWCGKQRAAKLTQVMPPPKRPKPVAGKIDALLQSAALTPKMTAEELYRETREP